jgi:hypothetical protein
MRPCRFPFIGDTVPLWTAQVAEVSTTHALQLAACPQSPARKPGISRQAPKLCSAACDLGSTAGSPISPCVPSHSGLVLDWSQRQRVTRLRVSKGSTSDRSMGSPPAIHTGPLIGALDVISVVTAICCGRSGSMSSPLSSTV